MGKRRMADLDQTPEQIERKKQRRAARAAEQTPRPTAQMNHASSNKAKKKAREGEQAVARERGLERPRSHA